MRSHRQLSRQRGGRVLLRDPQERDVLPSLVCHARGSEVHRDRLHRVLLQLQEPPLNNRLQRVPADVMDEFFERFESALSESREVLRAA